MQYLHKICFLSFFGVCILRFQEIVRTRMAMRFSDKYTRPTRRVPVAYFVI